MMLPFRNLTPIVSFDRQARFPAHHLHRLVHPFPDKRSTKNGMALHDHLPSPIEGIRTQGTFQGETY